MATVSFTFGISTNPFNAGDLFVPTYDFFRSIGDVLSWEVSYGDNPRTTIHKVMWCVAYSKIAEFREVVEGFAQGFIVQFEADKSWAIVQATFYDADLAPLMNQAAMDAFWSEQPVVAHG